MTIYNATTSSANFLNFMQSPSCPLTQAVLTMEKLENKDAKQPKLVEDVDFYFENGLMVLTADFLRKRGYCCKNECRHCPYRKAE